MPNKGGNKVKIALYVIVNQSGAWYNFSIADSGKSETY